MPPTDCPGPPGRLAALSLYRRPFGTVPGYLVALSREFGPMVRLRGPVRDLYAIDDPQLIEEVLVSKARSFRKGRGVSRLRRLLGNGLLTSEQPDHLRNRRLISPAFSRKRVEAYGPSMVAAALRRVAALPAVAALAAALGLDAVVVALALLARAEGVSDRGAARFFRAVLGAADPARVEAVAQTLSL